MLTTKSFFALLSTYAFVAASLSPVGVPTANREYTKEEFIERKQVYAQSIADLKAQLAQAKADVPEVIDYSERIITLQKIIETFKDPALDAQAKNDFLKEFIEDIRYDVIDYGRSKGGKPVLEIIFK